MKLSIIIPTRGRVALLQETLATIIPQLCDGAELVILDASPDFPNPILASQSGPHVRYERGTADNFDLAYDEAVNAARGEWVWLFSDDDWFKPGAVKTVLSHLDERFDILVVNTEVRDREMGRVLKPRWLELSSRDYPTADYDNMFAALGDLGTFVGCMVLRRQVWVERAKEAQPYFGSRFLTFVIPFLRPASARFLTDVLVSARFGHQGWISTCSQLIGETLVDVVWSLPLSDRAKAAVRPRPPGLGELVLWRALGSDVSKHSKWIPRLPRFAARAAIKLGLILTGRSGGIGDYMLTVTRRSARS